MDLELKCCRSLDRGWLSILAGFHRPQCQLDLTIHSQQQPPVTKQFTEVSRHSVLDCSIPLVDWRKENMHLVENTVYCDCKYYVNY